MRQCIRIGILGLGVALACLTAVAPEAAAAPGQLEGPARIGDFALVERKALGGKHGTSYWYRQPSGQSVSAFIFPAIGTFRVEGGGAAGAELAGSLAMVGQVREFKESLPELVRRGLYTAATIQSETPVKLGPARSGFRVTMTGSQRGAPVVSYFYIFLVGPELVKVRITAPQGASTTAYWDRFVSTLLTKLQ